MIVHTHRSLQLARMAWRGVCHHYRVYVSLACGCALAATVLVGALLVGASVRLSLADLAALRLGRVTHAVVSHDRFMTDALAARLSDRLDAPVAPVLDLRGSVSRGDAVARVNDVRVLGVDARFARLAPDPGAALLPEDGAVVLNVHLAARLGVRAGDRVVLRAEAPGAMPREAPLAFVDTHFSTSLLVAGVVEDDGFGRFKLEPGQAAPANMFVELEWLADRIGRPGRVNRLLIGERAERGLEAADVDEALSRAWRLEDAELLLNSLPDDRWIELRSERVFLSEAEVEAASFAEWSPHALLTYFVSGLRHGDRDSPYAFVTAAPPPWTPEDLSSASIVLSEWTARDIDARIGDEVTLDYLRVGPLRHIESASADFKVAAILPLDAPLLNAGLMPDYPGLADVDNCRDWNPGIPIDLDRIRPEDEDYWDTYGGTPRALVSPEAGQALWRNPFGTHTAVRYPSNGLDPDTLRGAIAARLDVAALGIATLAVAAEARAAADGGVDFGELFLGLSGFIVLSALLLVALLFSLGIERRSDELRMLNALGWPSGRLRKLLWLESALPALAGSALGALGGVLYNNAVIWALTNVWRGAVHTDALRPHLSLSALALGWASGLALALVVMGIGAWRVTARRKVRRKGVGRPLPQNPVGFGMWNRLPACFAARQAGRLHHFRHIRPNFAAIASLCLIGAVLIMFSRPASLGAEAAAAWFLAGALLLPVGLAATAAWVHGVRRGMFGGLLGRRGSSARSSFGALPTLRSLALRGAARRPGRSLSVVALLACGVFLVLAVAGNRHDPRGLAHERSSGTGGFAFYGQAALPLDMDPGDSDARRRIGLDGPVFDSVEILSLRRLDGADAGCLNIERVRRPTVLGVEAGALRQRGAFSFVRAAPGLDLDAGWDLLLAPRSEGVVPVVADQTAITWQLGLQLGDELEMRDRHGRIVRLQFVGGLANSILQDAVVMDAGAFAEHFGMGDGARVLLVDAPAKDADAVARRMMQAFDHIGLDLEPTEDRLARFSTVEHTYLAIFLALGGLGLLIGSLGVGIVVLRGVLERRGELALLRAVGFTRRKIVFLVFVEHAALVLAGLLVGATAGIVAVQPALSTSGASSWGQSLVLLVVLGGGALVWTALATVVALRGPLLGALRAE